MAKREVTLATKHWEMLANFVGQATAGPLQHEQAQRIKLVMILDNKAKHAKDAAGEAYTASFTSGRCRAVIEALETPGIPYTSRGLVEAWKIKEAFGWTPPDLDLYDDDDEEDDDK